jgi:hypothetical protein
MKVCRLNSFSLDDFFVQQIALAIKKNLFWLFCPCSTISSPTPHCWSSLRYCENYFFLSYFCFDFFNLSILFFNDFLIVFLFEIHCFSSPFNLSR